MQNNFLNSNQLTREERLIRDLEKSYKLIYQIKNIVSPVVGFPNGVSTYSNDGDIVAREHRIDYKDARKLLHEIQSLLRDFMH